jgi:homoserine O-succinyltransferase
MPILIPENLPARRVLESEGLSLMTEGVARRQDIRPLKIGLLNLMPDKVTTETQFARLIGATPLQVELVLLKVDSYEPRNISSDYMLSFYKSWQQISDEKFDGFIVTGAPVEHLAFERVDYWNELQRIFDWTQRNVHSNIHICWGAQAALYHFHGIPKHDLPGKAFGVFRHKTLKRASPYLRGFSDGFSVPVSRWTEVRRSDLPGAAGLEILAESDETGLCLINDPSKRTLYMFNHLEYDTLSLDSEFKRDQTGKRLIDLPRNYYPGDDPAQLPENLWRSHAHLLFGNWINEIYQTTPFDASKIGT